MGAKKQIELDEQAIKEVLHLQGITKHAQFEVEINSDWTAIRISTVWPTMEPELIKIQQELKALGLTDTLLRGLQLQVQSKEYQREELAERLAQTLAARGFSVQRIKASSGSNRSKIASFLPQPIVSKDAVDLVSSAKSKTSSKSSKTVVGVASDTAEDIAADLWS